MPKLIVAVVLLFCFSANAQDKKPLDHTVYDSWQAIDERMISNDGKCVVYTVNPQEGDGELVIQKVDNNYKKIIARGYAAVISEDNKYVLFKIRPFYQEIRQAKIKKKLPEEIPKDSLGMIEIGQDSVLKIAKIKTYKTPEKAGGWVAYLMEKAEPISNKNKATPDSASQIKNMLLMADSIAKIADSIRNKTIEAQAKGIGILSQAKKETKPTKNDADKIEEGTDLVFKNLNTGKERKIKLVTEYYFSKKANTLIVETSAKNNDSLTKPNLLWIDLATGKTDTILIRFNDAKNYTFDEDGNQLAFVAERDSVAKALTKFYKLYYFKKGNDSAIVLADKKTIGIKSTVTISENANINFSKNGKKIFFGTAPIKAPKDTNLVDFELARLDVWHYNDDYLQPQQLKQLETELKRSYTAVINLDNKNEAIQLGAEDAERITLVDKGNANWVLAESTKGNRVETQWTGRSKTSAYIINTTDGSRKLVAANISANFDASPAGKYVYWYDAEKKNYFTYNLATSTIKNVTEKIKNPLYDEENDVPDFPSAYGIMGWSNNDKNFYVYDRYEVWNVNPDASTTPTLLIDPQQMARKNKMMYRYISTNKEEPFINIDSILLFKVFDKNAKTASLEKSITKNNQLHFNNHLYQNNFSFPVKAKNADNIIFTKEDYVHSPNLFYADAQNETQLSDINPQQKNFNWGTAELFKWKTYNGKESEGIIYKPENFDAKKKYPMISYFYEKLSDGLYNYLPPSPTPSRLNISFFVSRGYIVFAPDISYTTGHPGNDAYNYIVSGVRAIIKLGFVDSTKLGLQGQSWGGYQTAILITKTKLFAAAWAGAPVVNMTSAYGGIRWGAGINRQFQYEKTQSRIGASLWEKQNLYLENSPLFHLPNVTTPLVIMSNDADDAVPFYQGIEFFTAMRRLHKPIWLLMYNNEAHNLVERKNRKDIQVREQQFFDWKLKGDKPAKWLTDGVPATQKGIDWGLKTE